MVRPYTAPAIPVWALARGTALLEECTHVDQFHFRRLSRQRTGQQAAKKPAVNFNDVLKAAGQSTQVAQSTSAQPSSTDTSTFTTTPTRTV